MNRRQILTLGAGGAFSTAGCLRLTDDEQQGQNAGGDGDTNTGSSSAGGAVYSTREEAIEHVSSFAPGDGQSLGTGDGARPELIAFSTSSGSSSSSGDDGSTLTSKDLRIDPSTDDSIRFDTSRAIRVRNLAVGSSLTFEPVDDFGTYEIDQINIDPGGDGTLRDRAPELSVANEETTLESPGEWTGDRDVFTHQPIARYIVELLENGSVIGRTEAQPFGTGYQWAFDQTQGAAFITRHPGIPDEWHVEFTLGRSRFDPIERVTAIQLVDQNVFEIDLTLLDVEADEYDWRLRIVEEEGASRDVLGLGSVFGNGVFVG